MQCVQTSGRNLDCFRHRKEFYIFSHQCQCSSPWRGKVYSPPHFPQLHRLQHGLCLFGKGKLSAWAAWKCYPAVTDAFRFIAENPFVAMELNSHHFKLLERFTVVLYDKTSQLSSVDEARRELFYHRNKMMMEALPPTQGALLQHSSCAVYQASI